VATPDGMAMDRAGNVVVACPNYADMKKPAVFIRIDRQNKATRWFDCPVLKETGRACPMGIAFGPDGDLYVCDNQNWPTGNGKNGEINQGRILRLRVRGNQVEKCTVVAGGLSHPNGVRIWKEQLYVTNSLLPKIKNDDGLLARGVQRLVHARDKAGYAGGVGLAPMAVPHINHHNGRLARNQGQHVTNHIPVRGARARSTTRSREPRGFRPPRRGCRPSPPPGTGFEVPSSWCFSFHDARNRAVLCVKVGENCGGWRSKDAAPGAYVPHSARGVNFFRLALLALQPSPGVPQPVTLAVGLQDVHPVCQAVQDLLPRIRETRQKLVETDKDWEKKDNDLKRDILAIDNLIAAIEADKNPAHVRSMEEFTGARTRP
jgi:hypothetical protein